jgi:hypothetical protein
MASVEGVPQNGKVRAWPGFRRRTDTLSRRLSQKLPFVTVLRIAFAKEVCIFVQLRDDITTIRNPEFK